MTRRISLLDRAFSLLRAASSSCSAMRGWTPSDDAASFDEPPWAATRATNHSLRDRPLSIDGVTLEDIPRNAVRIPPASANSAHHERSAHPWVQAAEEAVRLAGLDAVHALDRHDLAQATQPAPEHGPSIR